MVSVHLPSDALSQHIPSYLGYLFTAAPAKCSYCSLSWMRGISSHRPSWPWTWSSSSRPLLCLCSCRSLDICLLVAQMVKNLPANAGDTGRRHKFCSGWWRASGEEMPILSCILAWKVPWTEEPGGSQFMESQCQTRLSAWTHMHCYYYLALVDNTASIILHYYLESAA